MSEASDLRVEAIFLVVRCVVVVTERSLALNKTPPRGVERTSPLTLTMGTLMASRPVTSKGEVEVETLMEILPVEVLSLLPLTRSAEAAEGPSEGEGENE